MDNAIKLVLCDIDGCLNAGLHEPLDLTSLLEIAQQVQFLSKRGTLFALCTGRPVPFAQAMGQMIGVTAPLICENGAIVFDPLQGASVTLVEPAALSALTQFADQILKTPKWAGQIWLEPGKTVCVSINGPPITGRHPDQIKAVIAEMQTLPNAKNFHWAHSNTAIDITPKGIDKATGANWLLNSLGLDWSLVAAIGDSNGDLPVMTRCALPLCPANADPAIKAISAVCATNEFSAGTAQLLKHNFLKEP